MPVVIVALGAIFLLLLGIGGELERIRKALERLSPPAKPSDPS